MLEIPHMHYVNGCIYSDGTLAQPAAVVQFVMYGCEFI